MLAQADAYRNTVYAPRMTAGDTPSIMGGKPGQSTSE